MEYSFYVGVDWGSSEHAVCVLGEKGDLVLETRVQHEAGALRELAARLESLAKPGEIAVGIETSGGPLVETLLAHDFAVFSINPKQLDRFRDRFSAAGSKDDRKDALVLASSLRTDRGAFRLLQPEAAWVLQVRELSRTAEELTSDCVRLSNQLRAQLERYYPQALKLMDAPDSLWVLDLLELAPTPEAGAKLREAVIKRVLREHRIRKRSVEQVREQLRAVGFDRVSKTTSEIASQHVELLVPRLRLAVEQRRNVERRLARVLLEQTEGDDLGQKNEHSDTAIVLSLPGVGTIIGAAVLGEGSHLLAARNYHGLRAAFGSAPVTRQTGKQRSANKSGPRPLVFMRRACNPRLRRAAHLWAGNSILVDEKANAYYRQLRDRGHGHARALRSLADRWLRILVAMLETRSLYDASRIGTARAN